MLMFNYYQVRAYKANKEVSDKASSLYNKFKSLFAVATPGKSIKPYKKRNVSLQSNVFNEQNSIHLTMTRENHKKRIHKHLHINIPQNYNMNKILKNRLYHYQNIVTLFQPAGRETKAPYKRIEKFFFFLLYRWIQFFM